MRFPVSLLSLSALPLDLLPSHVNSVIKVTAVLIVSLQTRPKIACLQSDYTLTGIDFNIALIGAGHYGWKWRNLKIYTSLEGLSIGRKYFTNWRSTKPVRINLLLFFVSSCFKNKSFGI